MSWWGWTVIGILLLASELFAIDAQFYLVFIGASAVLVGLAQLIGLGLPVWMQWMSFGVLSVVLMFSVRRKLYDMLRGPAPDVGSITVGQIVQIPEELPPGGSCRAEFQGSTWKAVNVDDTSIPAGGTARIEVVDGLTLRVRHSH